MSGNNDVAGAAIALAILVGVMLIFGIFIIVALFCLTLVLTIVSIMAWHRPVRFFHHLWLPHEARRFVGGGIFVMLFAPTWVGISSLIFGFHVPADTIPVMLMVGYVAGSVGCSVIAELFEAGAPQDVAPPPAQPVTPPEPAALPSPPRAEFTFASWDDEEPRR